MGDVKTGYFLVAGYHMRPRGMDPSYVVPVPVHLHVAQLNGVREWTMRAEERFELNEDNDKDIETVLARKAAMFNSHLWWLRPQYEVHNHIITLNIARALRETLLAKRQPLKATPLSANDKRRVFARGMALMMEARPVCKDLAERVLLEEQWPPSRSKETLKYYR